jgi:RNA polymerase sigma factor (TIGR02999 family)
MSQDAHGVARELQPAPQSAGELLPLVYDELRQLAAARLSHEAPGQTLQPTALVHEAYLRLVDVSQEQQWNSRGHFFAAAAEAMRRILVERARRKKTEKQGGGRRRIELANAHPVCSTDPDELLMLDEALSRLAQVDAAAAEIAKLRIFAGLSVKQAGESLGISRATAHRHWTYARAVLRAEMLGLGEPPA